MMGMMYDIIIRNEIYTSVTNIKKKYVGFPTMSHILHDSYVEYYFKTQ